MTNSTDQQQLEKVLAYYRAHRRESGVVDRIIDLMNEDPGTRIPSAFHQEVRSKMLMYYRSASWQNLEAMIRNPPQG